MIDHRKVVIVMNGIPGISSANSIANPDRLLPVRRPSGAASSQKNAVPSSGRVQAVQVPNLGSVQALTTAVEDTERVWRELATALESADERGARRLMEEAGFAGPVEWPDVPPREPPAGEMLAPLRSQLMQRLEPSLQPVEEAAQTLASAKADGELPDPDTVQAGLRELERFRDSLSEVLQQEAVRQMGEARAEPLSDATAEAVAEEVAAVVQADPAAAVSAGANLEPEDVLSLLD